MRRKRLAKASAESMAGISAERARKALVRATFFLLFRWETENRKQGAEKPIGVSVSCFRSPVSCPPPCGFVLPSAVFLLVILAGLAAFLVSISQTQNVISAQDVQGARAYRAARAGIEWGLYRVLDPAYTPVSPPGEGTWPSLPACAGGALSIEGFTVRVVCDPYPSASGMYTEGIIPIRLSRFYRLTATASFGVPGSPGFVEREIQATTGKCRMETGAPPEYECS